MGTRALLLEYVVIASGRPELPPDIDPVDTVLVLLLDEVVDELLPPLRPLLPRLPPLPPPPPPRPPPPPPLRFSSLRDLGEERLVMNGMNIVGYLLCCNAEVER